MALTFHKVTELPSSPAVDAIYAVENGESLLIYITDNTGTPHLQTTCPLWYIQDGIHYFVPNGGQLLIHQELFIEGELKIGLQANVMVTEWV